MKRHLEDVGEDVPASKRTCTETAENVKEEKLTSSSPTHGTVQQEDPANSYSLLNDSSLKKEVDSGNLYNNVLGELAHKWYLTTDFSVITKLQ